MFGNHQIHVTKLEQKHILGQDGVGDGKDGGGGGIVVGIDVVLGFIFIDIDIIFLGFKSQTIQDIFVLMKVKRMRIS